MRLANIAAAKAIEFRGTKSISISELAEKIAMTEKTKPDYFLN